MGKSLPYRDIDFVVFIDCGVGVVTEFALLLDLVAHTVSLPFYFSDH